MKRNAVKLLVTGFSVFPGAPVNPTESLIRELRRHSQDIDLRCDFKTAVLQVDFASIGEQLSVIATRFAPDIALHFGLDAAASGFRLERFGRNHCTTDRPDNSGNLSQGIMMESGPEKFESTLPRTEIVDALTEAGLPATLDDQAGDYLCNAVFYLSRSGQCGEFKPAMSGFIHVPQLPMSDGGTAGEGQRLALADLVDGAKIVIETCIDQWNERRAAG